MTSIALPALAQDHFNEMGKMKSLINKRKSTHHPKPIFPVSLLMPGDEAWAEIRWWKLTPGFSCQRQDGVRTSPSSYTLPRLGWWGRWKWTCVGVKQRQHYGKRKRPALKRNQSNISSISEWLSLPPDQPQHGRIVITVIHKAFVCTRLHMIYTPPLTSENVQFRKIQMHKIINQH